MMVRPYPFVLGILLIGATPLRGALFSHVNSEEEILRKITDLSGRRGSKAEAGLYSDLGTLYFRKGEMQRAVDAFEKALQMKTTSAMKAHIYRYLGKSYEILDRLDRSIEAAESAAAYNSRYWRCHRDLARLYEMAFLYRKAIDSYRRAIKYNPKESPLYVELGRTWRKLGLYGEAESCFKKAQDMGNTSSSLFQEFSLVYEGQGRFDESAEAFQKVLTGDSTPGDWGRLIYLSALAGDRERANGGLNSLRELETPAETVLFYEELVDLMQKSPQDILTLDVSDPTLKTLVRSVRPISVP